MIINGKEWFNTWGCTAFQTISLRLITQGKNDACRPKLRCKNAKEGRLLSVQQRGDGHLPDSGGRESIMPNIGGLLYLQLGT